MVDLLKIQYRNANFTESQPQQTAVSYCTMSKMQWQPSILCMYGKRRGECVYRKCEPIVGSVLLYMPNVLYRHKSTFESIVPVVVVAAAICIARDVPGEDCPAFDSWRACRHSPWTHYPPLACPVSALVQEKRAMPPAFGRHCGYRQAWRQSDFVVEDDASYRSSCQCFYSIPVQPMETGRWTCVLVASVVVPLRNTNWNVVEAVSQISDPMNCGLPVVRIHVVFANTVVAVVAAVAAAAAAAVAAVVHIDIVIAARSIDSVDTLAVAAVTTADP